MKSTRTCCKGFIFLLALIVIGGTYTGSCFAVGPENIATAAYVSSRGKHLTARYDITSKKVTLTLPDGKTLTLPQAVSASGARYSDGTTTFWEHQGTATLYKGERVVFEGKEVPKGSADQARETASAPPCEAVADVPICNGAARYAAHLKRTDKNFGNPSPTDPNECQLDAGKGKPPISAFCTNTVNRVTAKGDWASVAFVFAPVEKKYRKLPVMADGALYFLMKKDKIGNWHGIGWFLGSDDPSLGKKKIKEIGIAANILTSLGWRAEEE